MDEISGSPRNSKHNKDKIISMLRILQGSNFLSYLFHKSVPYILPTHTFFLQLKHYRPHRPFWIYIYINCLLLVWLALSCIFTKICISGHSLITLVSGSILFFFWFFMFILPFHQPKYGLWHTDFTVLLYHVIYLQLKFSYLKSFFSKYAETLFNLVSLISDPVRLKKC